MGCKDQQISELLPDYFTRHLSGDDMKSVSMHLEKCRSCQESLGVMEYLNGRKPSTSGNDAKYHLTHELLASYYDQRDSLDPQTVKRVEQHLVDCQECADSLAFLTDLEVKLKQSPVWTPPQSSLSGSFLETLVAFARRPALAYLLVLIMAYPAVRWITFAPTAPVDNGLVSTNVFVIGEQNRSSGNIPQVLRRYPADIVHLRIPFYHLNQVKRYSVTITSVDSESPLGAEFILDFSEQSSISVILSTRELTDGIHVLHLSESNRDESEKSSDSRYSFELISQ